MGIIHEFGATNGMAPQLVSISTGAAKDNPEAGRSQSTLMFIHSPSLNIKEFADYWLSQFEINAKTKPSALGINTLKSFYIYNGETQLHKEITFLSSPQGSYWVSYLGMDGAFQTNRQHFLDFLSQVNITEATTANKAMQPTAKVPVQ
ncbi:MAG: hypothetical protein ACJAVV_001174 [Alphaproteobacteria bacterium]|jgi:hypothetical protein